MRLKSLHNITVGVRFTLTRVYVITIIINPALLSFRSSVLFHTLSYHSCRVYGFTLRRRCVGIKGFGPLNMVSIFASLPCDATGADLVLNGFKAESDMGSLTIVTFGAS